MKASYDKIIFPPPGVVSNRQGEYRSVEAVEAPDPSTVVFRLKWPAASFVASLASPFNWIYKADILARDVHWYEKNVMGTGPFVFVEYVKGSHWLGRRNPAYWDKGKPYLDGYRAIFVRESATQVAAIRGQRAMIQFRGFSPPERDTLVQALGQPDHGAGEPLGVLESARREPREKAVRRPARAPGAQRWPSTATRARQACRDSPSSARCQGCRAWARRSPPRPDELATLAGYSRDIAKSRAEARRLLKEAGVPDGFAFTFKNRGIPNPYEALGIWLADQWRQIGLNVQIETLELGMLYNDIRAGNFEVAADFHCSYIVEPDLALFKFQSTDISPVNYSHYVDRTLDALYQKQSRTTDREERRRYIRDFERRLLDEEAHYIYTFQWHRIVPHNARVRGWTITPSHFLNNQLDTVWLAE